MCSALHVKGVCLHAYKQLVRLGVRGGLLGVIGHRSQSGQVDLHIIYISQHAQHVTVTGCATVADSHDKIPEDQQSASTSPAEHQKKTPKTKAGTLGIQKNLIIRLFTQK